MAKQKKVAVEFDEAIHGEELKKLIEDALAQKFQAQGFMQLVKDNKTKAKEELGVDSKLWGKLMALKEKDIRESFETETTEVLDTYDAIFAKK